MEGSPNATRQFPDHLLHWKVELLPLSGLTCYKTDNSVNVTEVSQKASFPPSAPCLQAGRVSRLSGQSGKMEDCVDAQSVTGRISPKIHASAVRFNNFYERVMNTNHKPPPAHLSKQPHVEQSL